MASHHWRESLTIDLRLGDQTILLFIIGPEALLGLRPAFLFGKTINIISGLRALLALRAAPLRRISWGIRSHYFVLENRFDKAELRSFCPAGGSY